MVGCSRGLNRLDSRAVALTLTRYDDLPEYERGWIDGVYLSAWMKDGVMFVGTTGRTYRAAVDEFLAERGVELEHASISGLRGGI